MIDVVSSIRKRSASSRWQAVQECTWWLLFGICLLYGLYALYLGGVEIGFLLGQTADTEAHSLPPVFVVHSLSGAVVLVSGILQFNQPLRVRRRMLHRALGHIYVVAVGFASLGGLWLAFFFDVTVIAQVIFVALAILWFSATTLAFRFARARKIDRHRAWMYRSFALSFFFVTFSFWVDGLASLIPGEFAYPAAVFVSWSLNLLVVERWLRFTRQNRTPHARSINRETSP